jgi:spore germination protein YaaH
VKIRSALASGIDKIAAWSVGQEDPRTWEVINRKP